MGTFAGDNGRRSTDPAAGEPTRDEAYERVAREFLRKFALDADEGFAAAVARRFKEAPAKVCCRAIGKWIDKKLIHAGWTQNELADRIGVDRSAVAKWTAGGAISLGHLVLVLLEFRSDFADLPLPGARNWHWRATSPPSRWSGRGFTPPALPNRNLSIANASGVFSTSFPNRSGKRPSGGKTGSSSRERWIGFSGGRASRLAFSPEGSFVSRT